MSCCVNDFVTFDIRFFLENLVETCLQTFFYEVLKNGLTEKKIEEH